jgi:pterin-4a-carbinolamine dehydratase/1-acyl-sn-glycerol-3-phosphate acyltransferase
MWALAVLAVIAAVLLVRWRRSGLTLDVYLCLAVVRFYTGLWHRWSSNGTAPLPAEGPAILIANHTCSADPTFLVSGCRRLISFLVAREHYNIFAPTRRLLDYMGGVPVTRDGKDAGAVRAALRRLKEGRVLGVFPEGNLSGVAKNRLRPGKAGVALLALRSRAPVYPAYIAGGPRTEKLVQSWLLPSRRPVRVTFGPPVDLSAYYDRPVDRALLEEVTALLMGRIAALGGLPTPDHPHRFSPKEDVMTSAVAAELTRKRCAPCEGGVPPLSREQVQNYLAALPGWQLTADGQRIRREWRVKDFVTGLDFFNRIGRVAEEEDHHPDLHLTGYRNAAVEIWTHAIGGLSENDFILAAKIDTLPVELKK